MTLFRCGMLLLVTSYVRSSILGPDESVLHPNVQVITINDQIPEDGSLKSNQERTQVSGNIWSSTQPEIGDKNKSLDQSDYREIPNKINLLQSNLTSLLNVDSYVGPLTVEVLLVCDKEFSDKFNQNRKRILDYWTVYFWDVNMRFKTLPSSQISFRINAVIIMATKGAQPFIEESRGVDGRANTGRILDRFSPWVYANMNVLPKFDIAIAVTNTELETPGGIAWLGGACGVDHVAKTHWGTLVFNDKGDFGSVTTGAHEIAHSLGALEDGETNWGGYIMNGGSDNLRWFFSPKSDQEIANFVNGGASCLRVFDQYSSEISLDFSAVKAPTFEEQCRMRLNIDDAYVDIRDTVNCSQTVCKWNGANGDFTLWKMGAPVDNTPCVQGRCFRGRCRKVGKMLVNVGTNLCTKVDKPFYWNGQMFPVPCPSIEGATPMDQFVVEEAPNGNGLYFETPWNSLDGAENGDKCLYTGNAEGGRIVTDRCNFDNPWHGWQMVSVGYNGEFLLKHRVTGRCAKNNVGFIATYSECNAGDVNYRWILV